MQYNRWYDNYPHLKAIILLLEKVEEENLEIIAQDFFQIILTKYNKNFDEVIKILNENPPTDVYVYVDRIKCYKNGDFSQTESSAQAYAWFFWDKTKEYTETKLHWIRRVEK